MVQKSKKPAPQDDFRNLEIQSVFNTNKHQHGIPQKELETRINQIYQVFEGKWQKADIRRALEENEYNVEEVIKLRLEGGEQWTEVKKKPTPQELRKKHSEIVNTGAPRGRPGRGSARGRGRGGVDRSNGRALKKSDDQKIEDTSNLTVPTGESIETTTVDQQQHIGSEIEIEHVATEGADKSQRTKQPRDDKKKSRSEKFVPAQPRQEQVLSYSQVAAISDEVKPQQQEEKEEKPQKVNINKKQQTKPKRRPQDQQDNLRQQTSTKTVEQPPVTIQQQTVQPVTHTQQQPKVQQRQREEPKKFINAQPDSLPTTSTTTGFRSSGIQFGSLSNDEHVEEEQQQQPKVPQQQEQQPSAPQIQNRRQSQHENQSLQDFNYQGNTGSWGEEQQYQQQYNQDTMNQFHENQGFFANNYVPHHQQQPNETSATTGTKGDKDTQNSQKQANYSGYPMHPYTNPMQAQGYSYYGGYPHPYMLHGQYAQQQYGYSMQQYPKYGFKGYSGPTSPTYGSGAPSDEKGNQQQQQQQQQHQQHQQQHMMHNQYGMAPYMMMPQYIPDPSATEKQESLKNRSPQNADHAEQHGMQYYPYGVPYSQYANYMYQPHPHSTMFAHQHQQGPQSTQSGTHAHQQQQRGANDTWSS